MRRTKSAENYGRDGSAPLVARQGKRRSTGTNGRSIVALDPGASNSITANPKVRKGPFARTNRAHRLIRETHQRTTTQRAGACRPAERLVGFEFQVSGFGFHYLDLKLE